MGRRKNDRQNDAQIKIKYRSKSAALIQLNVQGDRFLTNEGCPFREQCRFAHFTQHAIDALPKGGQKGGKGTGAKGGRSVAVAVVCTTPSLRLHGHLEVHDIEGNPTMRKARPVGCDKQWPLRRVWRQRCPTPWRGAALWTLPRA